VIYKANLSKKNKNINNNTEGVVNLERMYR
jgi:hypothetical protein